MERQEYQNKIDNLAITSRVERLKSRALVKERFVSIEQAKIITKCYQEHEHEPIAKKRALSFREACRKMEIGIDPDELRVGHRTRAWGAGGVVPAGGGSWA